jgi:hypothetical protein
MVALQVSWCGIRRRFTRPRRRTRSAASCPPEESAVVPHAALPYGPYGPPVRPTLVTREYEARRRRRGGRWLCPPARTWRQGFPSPGGRRAARRPCRGKEESTSASRAALHTTLPTAREYTPPPPSSTSYAIAKCVESIRYNHNQRVCGWLTEARAPRSARRASSVRCRRGGAGWTRRTSPRGGSGYRGPRPPRRPSGTTRARSRVNCRTERVNCRGKRPHTWWEVSVRTSVDGASVAAAAKASKSWTWWPQGGKHHSLSQLRNTT